MKLGDLEAMLLYAVCRCGNDAYGAAIAADIKRETGDDLAMGAIYATLDRLERKELLRSWWTAPVRTRGGRSKRVFEITAAGATVLSEYDRRLMTIRAGWVPVPQVGQ